MAAPGPQEPVRLTHLRHEYERVAYDVLWRVVQDDLPPLEKICREELARERAAERGSRKPST